MSSKRSGRGPRRGNLRGRKRSNKSDLWPLQTKNNKPSDRWVAIPPESDRILPFSNFGVISGASVNNTRNFVVNSNQPTGSGGNAPAEFVQYATLYDMYRPVAVEMEVTLANNESFPVAVAYAFTAENPGVAAPYDQMAAERIGQNALLSGKGGQDRVKWRRFIRFSDIVGSNVVETDDTYRALINAVPADTVWFSIGTFSPSGSNLTLGVAFQIRFKMHIRFYNADLTLQEAPPSLAQKVLDDIQAARDARRKALTLHKVAETEKERAVAMDKFLSTLSS